jgi:hypothetical protein
MPSPASSPHRRPAPSPAKVKAGSRQRARPPPSRSPALIAERPAAVQAHPAKIDGTPPSKKGGLGAGLESARARLERDAVELLMRQKQELEDECERLRLEVEKKADTFKVAWQEERAAHQRDVEASAAARTRADDEGQRMVEELRAAQDELQRLASSSDAEIARLRKALDATRAAKSSQAREAQDQAKALQRQLARLRAEKGELCEEFSSKLAAITQATRPDLRCSSGALSIVGTCSSDGGSSSSGGGAIVAANGLGSGYEGLSVFSDPTGAGALQLRSAINAAVGSDAEASGSDLSAQAADRSRHRMRSAGLGAAVEGRTGDGGGVDAAEDARRAIASMRLAQQLRNAESELEKLGRLEASKSRRVSELEAEAESLRLQAAASTAEAAEAVAERLALTTRCEREAARADRLQADVTKLEAAMAKGNARVAEMQAEQMRLVAQIDTLQLTAPRAQERTRGSRSHPTATGARAGHGSGRASADSWRPPSHPPGLLRNARLAPMMPLPPGGTASGGTDVDAMSARSNTSTISGGEWPDELHLG